MQSAMAKKTEDAAIHTAAADGNLKALQDELEKGGSLELAGKSGDKPLMRAANNGHLQTVKFLVKRKAVVDAVSDDS